MPAKIVALFPGQGAYTPGALAGFANRPEVTGVLADVDVIGAEYGVPPVSPLLLDRTAPGIDALIAEEPDRLALAIFAGGVAGHTMLPEPAGVFLGHSLGEIAALTAAGVFTVADGARVVCARNTALRSCPPPPGGLLAVPLSVERVEQLLAGGGYGLEVAAVNGPRQTVVSGPDAEVDHFARLVAVLDAPAVRLRSPYSYHHRSCSPAARLFADAISTITVQPVAARVFSSVEHRFYPDGDSARAVLPRHLTHRVRFLDALRHLHAHGADEFVECGPGGVLTGLVRATLVGVTTRTVFDIPRTEPAEPPSTTPPQAAPDRSQLIAELCASYANRLGYPEEVLTEDADLEADLGVDSLKRTELLNWTAERYSLTVRPETVRVDDYPTVSTIADFVLTAGELRHA